MPTTTAPPPGTPPRSAAVAGGTSDVPPTTPMPIGPWDAPRPVIPGPPRDVALTVGRVVGWLAVLWFGASPCGGHCALGDRRPAVHLPGLLGLSPPARSSPCSRRWCGRSGPAPCSPQSPASPSRSCSASRSSGGTAAWASRTVRPVTRQRDPSRLYEHAVGKLDLDLSQTEFPPARPASSPDRRGRAEVTVPWDATRERALDEQAGSLEVLGRIDSRPRPQPAGARRGRAGAPTLELDLHAELGRVHVVRSFEPETKVAARAGHRRHAAVRRRRDTRRPATCTSHDGYPTPELDCIVEADSGYAVCRPVGRQSESMRELQTHAGTQHCRVPANGGTSACDPPTAEPPPPTDAPGDDSANHPAHLRDRPERPTHQLPTRRLIDPSPPCANASS